MIAMVLLWWAYTSNQCGLGSNPGIHTLCGCPKSFHQLDTPVVPFRQKIKLPISMASSIQNPQNSRHLALITHDATMSVISSMTPRPWEVTTSQMCFAYSQCTDYDRSCFASPVRNILNRPQLLFWFIENAWRLLMLCYPLFRACAVYAKFY